MDIAPPWYELSHQGCSGETRGCSGGDGACHDQAAKDGYVAISLYSFCRRDQVRTEPRLGGLLLMAALILAAGGAVMAWKRRKRA